MLNINPKLLKTLELRNARVNFSFLAENPDLDEENE